MAQRLKATGKADTFPTFYQSLLSPDKEPDPMKIYCLTLIHTFRYPWETPHTASHQNIDTRFSLLKSVADQTITEITGKPNEDVTAAIYEYDTDSGDTLHFGSGAHSDHADALYTVATTNDAPDKNTSPACL